jgi:hypothetical protein
VHEDPHDYNWGRSQSGCNNLVCQDCQQPVSHSVRGTTRHYECECTKWPCRGLESVTTYRTEGPADIPIEMPPWRCAGHPLMTSPGPLSAQERDEITAPGEPVQMARRWDIAYHRWAHTERSVEVLQLTEAGPSLARLHFYSWNPSAPGSSEVAELVADWNDTAQSGWASGILARVYKATRSEAVLEQMRDQAFRPGWSEKVLRHLDKSWLREHAAEIVRAAPDCAEELCRRAGMADYGWDQDALRELPLEVLRAGAATMGRTRLKADELEVYWERDYEWLIRNIAQLCQQASDFYFYIEDFLLHRNWVPGKACMKVWYEQAMDVERAYNALPQLVRHDPEWVMDNLAEIIVRSKTRGVWLVDLLKRVGVNIKLLLPVLEASDPEDLKSHLPLWFPKEHAKPESELG